MAAVIKVRLGFRVYAKGAQRDGLSNGSMAAVIKVRLGFRVYAKGAQRDGLSNGSMAAVIKVRLGFRVYAKGAGRHVSTRLIIKTLNFDCPHPNSKKRKSRLRRSSRVYSLRPEPSPLSAIGHAGSSCPRE
jgi:hypothetical protein